MQEKYDAQNEESILMAEVVKFRFQSRDFRTYFSKS